MNAANECHEIPGCPGLYVDAFRGAYLKKTQQGENKFILTHYHGDHYGSLPRDGKYRGEAVIHCTPVTAALLREVHQVPTDYIMEHAYGDTFGCLPKVRGLVSIENKGCVKITLYDANHCPGAAIVLIELPDGKVHLHTGDMRYHPKMRSFPLIRQAVMNRKIDLLFLDTTYGQPKHNFQPQEVAVESIASQVHGLLGSQRTMASHKTLVLLSCYSIGKEKVLWEASSRCNQKVYVTDKKLGMLKCIQGYSSEDASSDIITRCTRNTAESDIHVVPMGLAGELWPFFRPNYTACADYALEISSSKYDKVVAFLPTGWADASNWNKKNAVSSATCKGIEVEVRLISYSEHSSFSELEECVAFLKPRKVIPTVFKDERDARRIAAQFPVDEGRAKQHFFKAMLGEKRKSSIKIAPSSTPEVEFVGVRKRKSPEGKHDIQAGDIKVLQDMGFHGAEVTSALRASKGNLTQTIESLLSPKIDVPCTTLQSPTSASAKKRGKSSGTTSGVTNITRFFSPKKSDY